MLDSSETNDCHTDYLHDNQHNPIDPHSVCDPGTHHPDVSCKQCETGIYELMEDQEVMTDTAHYTITIRKGWFGGELCYEARVAELPDVAEYADSNKEVHALAVDTIEVTEEIFATQGKAIELTED